MRQSDPTKESGTLLLERLRNLEQGYDRAFAVTYLKDEIVAVLTERDVKGRVLALEKRVELAERQLGRVQTILNLIENRAALEHLE